MLDSAELRKAERQFRTEVVKTTNRSAEAIAELEAEYAATADDVAAAIDRVRAAGDAANARIEQELANRAGVLAFAQQAAGAVPGGLPFQDLILGGLALGLGVNSVRKSKQVEAANERAKVEGDNNWREAMELAAAQRAREDALYEEGLSKGLLLASKPPANTLNGAAQ